MIYPVEDIEIKTIYRLYNKHTCEHLFISKKSEYYKLENKGWTKEAENLVKKGWKWDNNGNSLFYAAGDKKVYRLYNRIDGRHYYTLKVKEKEKLVGLSWVDEGVAWETLE